LNSSQYRRHFLLTAGMILLSFALLGFTFIGLSYNYSVQDQRANLNEKSRYIAALTGQVILLEPDQTDHFSAYLGAGARLTDSDVFLCDNDGEIFFCYEGGEIRSESVGSYIPNSVLTKLKSTGGYDDMTTLGLFAEQRFVSAAPITITRGPMTLTSGYAFVSVSTENLTSMWRTFATIFFFTAVVVLMIAFISRTPKVAVPVILITAALFIAIPALKGIYPVILPVVAVCAIAYSRLLYKKGKI